MAKIGRIIDMERLVWSIRQLTDKVQCFLGLNSRTNWNTHRFSRTAWLGPKIGVQGGTGECVAAHVARWRVDERVAHVVDAVDI